MPGPSSHTFPGTHVLQLVGLVERWGIDADRLLEGLELSVADLEAPATRLSCETLRVVSERARELTAEPGIGFYLGLQKRLSMYGNVGFAAMSASTVRDWIDLAVRYGPAISTALSLDFRVEGNTASLFVEEHEDLGSARDIGIFSLVLGLCQIAEAATGRTAERVSVDIPFPRPAYFDRFAHLLPHAHFDRPRAAIHFDARALDLPLAAPDRAALALAREACERELRNLGFGGALTASVRRALAKPNGSLPSIGEVAQAMRMSSRTLKRRLASEGVTYSEIVDRYRRERSIELLRTTDLSLDEIATRLDYSTVPSFTRAFRRWTGATPAQFRRGRKA